MKVTMLSTLCGPNGNATAGRVIDVPAAQAKILIDGDADLGIKYARPYDPDLDKRAKHGWEKYQELS